MEFCRALWCFWRFTELFGARSFAELCVALQSFAELCRALRSFAELCGALRSFAEFCGALQSFGELWGALQSFVELCGTLQSFAELCGAFGNFDKQTTETSDPKFFDGNFHSLCALCPYTYRTLHTGPECIRFVQKFPKSSKEVKIDFPNLS